MSASNLLMLQDLTNKLTKNSSPTKSANATSSEDSSKKPSSIVMNQIPVSVLQPQGTVSKKPNFAWNPIYLCKGDITTVPKEFSIVHCVGADLWLSDGVAKTLKETFDINNKLEELKKQQHPIGSIPSIQIDDNRFILNLVTKTRSIENPVWSGLKQSIMNLPNKCKELGITKICMPKIGSGLDALNWKKTMKLLKNCFLKHQH